MGRIDARLNGEPLEEVYWGRMSWDSWALGCPGSGNILFLRRMSSYF